jgi:hypothetical protein
MACQICLRVDGLESRLILCSGMKKKVLHCGTGRDHGRSASATPHALGQAMTDAPTRVSLGAIRLTLLICGAGAQRFVQAEAWP